MDLNHKILSDIAIHSKYARYLPQENRREVWDEIVYRTMMMHMEKFPDMAEEISWAFEYVYSRKVLPSMRSMQFAGKPILLNPTRGYNCAFMHISDVRAFSEAMFLLLGGTGVGYSVQKHHVAKLPPIRKPLKSRRYVVGDSIEGWADAIKILMKAYLGNGAEPKFDFSDIRRKGSLLVTSGGKAPGPEPLQRCLFNIKMILDRKEDGSQLTPLEAHDILCHIADAVLAGGIRRAAMISLFSVDDRDMLTCKLGNWWEANPQRGRANNSVVLLRSLLTREVFDAVMTITEESKAGEPGIFLTNDVELGINPCFAKDTVVMTTEGPKRIVDLVGKDFKALVNGEAKEATAFKTGTHPTFKLKTIQGYEVECTANHQFLLTTGEWKRADELNVDDKIVIHSHGNREWEGNGTFKEGWLLGSLVGDGHLNDEQAGLSYWGDNRQHMIDLAIQYINDSGLNPERRITGGNATVREDGVPRMNLTSRSLRKLANHYDLTHQNKTATDTLRLGTSSAFTKGFLRGYFDADGSVQGNLEKGISIRLSSVNLKSLKTVQQMLLNLGIYSTIYEERAKEGWKMLPNREGQLEKYYCQASHELVISRDCIDLFADRIGFNEPAKSQKLEELLTGRMRKPYKTRYEASFKELTATGKTEDVYDLTVDYVHALDANGFYAHNCAEISLNTEQFCNLCEINTSNIESQEDFENRAKAATIIGTIQASYTDFHYLRDSWKRITEKEALLGIGMTGVASGIVEKLDMGKVSGLIVKWNRELAKKIGINPAARTTTIKPSGTTSIVLGTSSGMHAWHAPYYLRRMRFGKNEAIYQYLKDILPECIEDEYFRPDEQAVIAIPVKAPENAALRAESPITTLERMKMLHERWIKPGHIKGVNTHNVSCTVSVKDEEWPTIRDWLWENRNSYAGVSLLPYDGGSYKQTPFEDITELEYEQLSRNLKEIDLRFVREIDDMTQLTDQAACSGGACEVK